LIGLIVIAGLLFVGIAPRVRRQKKITDAARAMKDALPAVNVVTAGQAPAVTDLELPGNVEAIQTTSLAARTNGYLRDWYVDIGDRVHKGQLMAEIETPEVEQQLQQARATLGESRASLAQAQANLRQAQTNLAYTRVTYERWNYLAAQHVVSNQERDQTWEAYNAAKATVDANQATVNVARATIAANEANVRQLEILQGFQKVYAPFDGVVTARNVEVGSLINAGSGANVSAATGSPPTGTTTPGTGGAQTSPGIPSAGGGLFQIARIDTLRIYINVPQTFSSAIKQGQEAEIHVREFPRNKYAGQLARTTNALDPTSRTMLTEVRTTNPANGGHQLLPGMYATVKISVIQAEPAVRIPATALVIRADGPQVVTVDADQVAHFQKVVIGRDYGNQLDLLSGLDPGATIVVNVPDDLRDGGRVVVRPTGVAPTDRRGEGPSEPLGQNAPRGQNSPQGQVSRRKGK
jgi:multidrug efflux pump subunit AcrA (membrane-fusion protein)